MKRKRRQRFLLVMAAAALLSSVWVMPAASADVASGTASIASAAADGGSSDDDDASAEGDSVGDAGAKSSISKEQAEKLARQYVKIPNDYKLQGASFTTRKKVNGTGQIWAFDFIKRKNDKPIGSIRAAIDAGSGQLLSFYSYEDQPNAQPTYPLKVDRAAAERQAAGFMVELARDYASQVKWNEDYGVRVLPPLSGEVRHELRYDRMVNGIPYADNYIQLEINSEGHVLSYELEWDDTITFPEASKPMSLIEAEQSIRKRAEPELAYLVPYGMRKKEPMLTYRLPSFAIDAVTGERLPEDNQSFSMETVEKEPLTAKPLATPPKPGKLTEAEAIALVEKAFQLPEGSKLQQSSFNEYENEAGITHSRWSLNWSVMKDGKAGGYAHASVDGSTGVISNYYGYTDEKSTSEPTSTEGISLDAAVEKAVEVIKKQLPWLTDQIHLQKPLEDNYKGRKPEHIGSYYIPFVRKIHGATVVYDHLAVGINAMTGEADSFGATLSSYKYPAQAPKPIEKSQVMDRFMDYYKVGLTYRLSKELLWNGEPLPFESYSMLVDSGKLSEKDVDVQTKVELIYRLVSKPRHENVFLDAQSGEWRNSETGETTSLQIPKAMDAAGHWAEESLGLMVAYKALELEDGKVRPNEVITRGELIKMLVLARSGGRQYSLDGINNSSKRASFNDVSADSAYFAYVESALEEKLIDLGDGSFNPDEKVSRDEMGELIVRALGYNALANHDHIFKSSFKDAADIQNKGQAAIVVGLKIMSLSDGKFLPKKQVTRGEASIAFFRYLQKRAELQEAPLRM